MAKDGSGSRVTAHGRSTIRLRERNDRKRKSTSSQKKPEKKNELREFNTGENGTSRKKAGKQTWKKTLLSILVSNKKKGGKNKKERKGTLFQPNPEDAPKIEQQQLRSCLPRS